MIKRGATRKVPSLVSLSLDCVASTLWINSASLIYLADHLKERILRKLLKIKKYQNKISFNQILPSILPSTLKTLDLSSITLTDESLTILQNHCQKLTSISLRKQDSNLISPFGLKNFFQATPKLLIIDVTQCLQFDDQVLTNLGEFCPKLQELCADGCPLTDQSLNSFAEQQTSLKCLTISNTEITGDGIKSAVIDRKMQDLQELRLDNCRKVNEDVLKLVVENCPKLEILTFYGCAISDEISIFEEIKRKCSHLKQLHWTFTW